MGFCENEKNTKRSIKNKVMEIIRDTVGDRVSDIKVFGVDGPANRSPWVSVGFNNAERVYGNNGKNSLFRTEVDVAVYFKDSKDYSRAKDLAEDLKAEIGDALLSNRRLGLPYVRNIDVLISWEFSENESTNSNAYSGGYTFEINYEVYEFQKKGGNS